MKKHCLTKYIHLFLKKKILKPYGRSVLQLQSVLLKNQKGDLKTFKFNEKIHSTMKKKIFIPRYTEHLHFLISRAGWIVTTIYAHYTFEQLRFKQDFVIMNQVSRQKATSKVEKDFYKLMNDSNFGNDCRNNIDNCNFKVVYDNTEEISYIQKYAPPYFDEYKDFACPETIKFQIEQEYHNEILSIKKKRSMCRRKKILRRSTKK